jgi:hypothetical protein
MHFYSYFCRTVLYVGRRIEFAREQWNITEYICIGVRSDRISSMKFWTTTRHFHQIKQHHPCCGVQTIFHLITHPQQVSFNIHPRQKSTSKTQAHLSMDPVNNTNMQSTENSPAHGETDDGHITGNQEPALAWTAPPISRPSSHPEGGRVLRTIFHWVTGVWEHVHWRQIFDQEKHDWHELHVSCSLPPPPIPRPLNHPVGGKAMRLRFYWETGQWEHEWENGSSLQLPPGPLVDFTYAGPLPPPPPSSKRPPAHAIHDEVVEMHFSYDEPQSCVFESEDGTRLPVPIRPGPS